jgi:hypothetical protein
MAHFLPADEVRIYVVVTINPTQSTNQGLSLVHKCGVHALWWLSLSIGHELFVY